MKQARPPKFIKRLASIKANDKDLYLHQYLHAICPRSKVKVIDLKVNEVCLVSMRWIRVFMFL
jgi:hypothetical protein